MEQTPNYHLNKPGYEEFGDVEVLNQNFAAIDTELKKNADAVGERVKTAELAEKVKQTVKDGSLTAKDLGAVSADTKGKANGVAGLDGNGKVPSGQLPEMNYEGKGAVDEHNKSSTAHAALFEAVNSAAAAAKSAADAVQTNLNTHTENKSNPHNVTADQVGAAAKDLSNVQFGLAFEEASLPSSESWRSVCFGNGKFVAVAAGSTKAAYSTDGITWTAATLPSSESWRSVCFGNGKFVAVAAGSNAVAYSADGTTWTAVTLPSTASWYSVCYGNGKFVAVAYNGTKAAYSTDGITWTAATLPSSATLGSVCYGNGKFVAVAITSAQFVYADASPSIVEQLFGAGMVRVQEMSSVGTGTYGSNNPTTLTFDIVPKVVFVQTIGLTKYHMWALYGQRSASTRETDSSAEVDFIWNQKQVSWFNASNRFNQLNAEYTYKVIALG